jgi:hypothetical protein
MQHGSFNTIKKTFNSITDFIDMKVGFPRLLAIRSGGDHGFRPSVLNCLEQGLGVAGFIGDDLFGFNSLK